MPHLTHENSAESRPSFWESYRQGHHRTALLILAGTFLLLTLAWAAVYVVDVYGLSQVGALKGAWWHLFRQGSPVEWIQWGFLALIFWHGSYLCGVYHQQGKETYARFWGWASASFVLMLIEDAGDPRHVLADYGSVLLGIPEKFIEGAVFAVMVAPLLWALLRYRQPLKDNPQILPYAVVGTILYGLVAISTLLRVTENLYFRVGRSLSESLTGGAVPPYFLVDFVIQETVEALAAAFLFAALLVYMRTARS